MGATTNHKLPFPELDDDNNPPADIKALAAALDAYLSGLVVVEHGRTTVGGLVTGTAASTTVTFAHDFSAAPRITVGIETNVPHFFDVGFDSITADSFRISVVRRAGSNTGLNVHWHAAF